MHLDAVLGERPDSSVLRAWQEGIQYFDNEIDISTWTQNVRALLRADMYDLLKITSSGEEALFVALSTLWGREGIPEGKNQILFVGSSPPSRLSLLGVVPLSCRDSVTSRTFAVSVALVDPWTGLVTPMEPWKRLCQERGLFLHVDMTHALGKIFFDPEEVGGDIWTFGGECFGAPRETGGILAKGGAKALFVEVPEVFSGPLLMALEVAALGALQEIDTFTIEVAALRDYFEELLCEKIGTGVSPLFQDRERAPHISLCSFPAIVGENLWYLLRMRDVYTLLPEEGCGDTLHFSFPLKMTREDVVYVVKVIAEVYAKLSICTLA